MAVATVAISRIVEDIRKDWRVLAGTPLPFRIAITALIAADRDRLGGHSRPAASVAVYLPRPHPRHGSDVRGLLGHQAGHLEATPTC